MAELASGAVGSLLGLLRNEALLLSRVGSDVEFIREEMESMHSFLEHLARTAPPAGGHDEQVRTWMKQVQDLAHDCSNCIDLYIRRGDPAFYRARGGRWRHLWWAKWLVQKMIAQHDAALRLRELKDRAHDVGQRRMRYGVEIPGKEATGGSGKEASSSIPADDEDDDEDDEDEQNQVVAAATEADHSDPLEPHVLEEYFANKLDKWLQAKASAVEQVTASIAIVAPDNAEIAGAVVRESLKVNTCFEKKIEIFLPAVHYQWDRPLVTSEILSYILRECELQNGTLQREMEKPDTRTRGQAHRYKSELSNEIWTSIFREINVWHKIQAIKAKIKEVDLKKLEENCLTDKCLGVLLHALWLVQNVSGTVGTLSSEEELMNKTASSLKDHMEAGKTVSQITLEHAQYQDILKVVFPTSKPPQLLVKEAATTSATTLGEDHIKEIIHNHKITLEIILGLLPKSQLLQGTSANEQATDVAAASVIKEHKEETKETPAVVTRDFAVTSVIKEVKEETKETLEVVTRDIPVASVINETKEEMEISREVMRDIPAAIVNETKEKLKELSTEVIKEIKEKMKEMSREVTSAIAADVIKEAKEKMKDISGETEVTSAFSAAIKETKEKLYQIRREIQSQLFIQGIVRKVQAHLKDKKTLIVFHDDEDYISNWGEMINALNLLHCAACSAVIVSTKNSKKAKEFCDPKEEPITCSLVGFYHDKVLKLTQQREKNSQILHDILYRCHPHEFYMNIFVGAICANPRRSYKELRKLHEDLIVTSRFSKQGLVPA